MRIAFDLSPVESNPAGIGQYTANLLSALTKQDEYNEYITYTTSPLLSSKTENVVIKRPSFGPGKGLRWLRAVARDAGRRQVDIMISPSNHILSWLFPRTIQFIHDLAPLKYPQYFGRNSYGITVRLAMRKAWKIATISETIKTELQQLHSRSDDTLVLYPGLNSWIKKMPRDPQLIAAEYNLPPKYILHLATLEPRKNQITLLKAFALLKQNYKHNDLKLVIVGKKGWFYEKIFAAQKQLNLDNEVIFLGYVPNEKLPVIYSQAEAFVFPSVYEGFGMPPAEALFHNLPTLVSDIPVFHECFGDMVRYAHAKSAEEFSAELTDILENPEKKNTSEQIAAKFSWEQTAQKLLAFINEQN
jgi:glycosyltransferase involved in cell wall biosynthesis